MPANIENNLQRVLSRIAAAAARAGRRAEEVQLVAVTKQRSLEEINPLLASGQRLLGENRIQELAVKAAELERLKIAPPVEWHFIGHVQTNKVHQLVGRVALIHGVDSLHLAEALQREAEKRDLTADILLELNISGEATKFGIAPANLPPVIDGLRPLDRVKCRGLMTMAPWECVPEETRPVFRGLRDVFERLRDEGHAHLDLRHLSMGMTNDFEVAVEEGATLVRVGTALFAPELYQTEG